jgi:rhamnose utilization protein RhaD (predicted bifunctional aldolase and dehydrogenase)
VLDGSPWPVNPAGYTLHSTIHGGIDGAHCVMHTHTTAGVAVASLQGGLSQSNFYSAQLHDMVAYHAFEGITIHAEEGPRVLASMGNKPAVILRNHGLLSWGQTLEQALCHPVDAAARLRDPAGHAEHGRRPSRARGHAAKCTRDALQFNPAHGAGRDVFDALVRQVDRIDDSYKK